MREPSTARATPVFVHVRPPPPTQTGRSPGRPRAGRRAVPLRQEEAALEPRRLEAGTRAAARAAATAAGVLRSRVREHVTNRGDAETRRFSPSWAPRLSVSAV